METLTAERRGAAPVGRRRERPFYTGMAAALLLVAPHPLRLAVGHTRARLSFATWPADLAG